MTNKSGFVSMNIRKISDCYIQVKWKGKKLMSRFCYQSSGTISTSYSNTNHKKKDNDAEFCTVDNGAILSSFYHTGKVTCHNTEGKVPGKYQMNEQIFSLKRLDGIFRKHGCIQMECQHFEKSIFIYSTKKKVSTLKFLQNRTFCWRRRQNYSQTV